MNKWIIVEVQVKVMEQQNCTGKQKGKRMIVRKVKKTES